MRAKTIYAMATGAGRAAIAVVRLSGPDARAVLRLLAGHVPDPRQADLVTLRHPSTHEVVDRCLILFFENPRSETGEDSAEFHLHGSRAVVAALFGILGALPNLRPAEPGEFARRAFLNGKLDLAQAEGLGDLIDAETQAQRRQALRQLSGAMREATAPWRALLVEAAARTETAIDFAEDVPADEGPHAALTSLLAPVLKGLRHELGQARAAERIRDGLRIVIAGPPNAGKSTLFNALVGREAAIVTAVAGTTRDPIEVALELGGCAITLTDTAGVRESDDIVERLGIDRARRHAAEADLVLWLSENAEAPRAEAGETIWPIRSKADRIAAADRVEDRFYLSVETGENVATLLGRLGDYARDVRQAGASGLLARARHREAFTAAERALSRIAADPDLPVELVAEELRSARFALERLVGAIDVDDILGDIFARFCIGK